MLIRCGGASVVVDLGLGALHGLLRRGLRHADVDALLFSHLHPDHTAELVPFLFASNYDEAPRRLPLLLVGGPGFDAFLRALFAAYDPWLNPKGYDRTVRELSAGEEIRVGSLECRAGPANHIPSSLAYRFRSGGRTVVISGDTGPSPELEEFARDADLLVLEASLPPGKEYGAHLTARQAGELAARAKARRLVLCHLYPSSDAAAPRDEAAKAFAGPILVAEDGMGLEA
jgi:ribonuclease BN (tRNA processing enzyme)